MVRQTDDHLLSCTNCRTADGHERKSAFDLARCPAPGMLDNQDGILTCIGVPNAADVPPGPYLQSCQGCQLAQSSSGRSADTPGTPVMLVCPLCRSAAGKQVISSFNLLDCLPPGILHNVDGRLNCEAGNANDIPPGSYSDSCRGCSLQRGDPSRLKCRCRAADGSEKETSYDLRKCPAPRSLINQDGFLGCSS